MAERLKIVPEDLDVNSKYSVRVRSVNSFGVASAWSEAVVVDTNQVARSLVWSRTGPVVYDDNGNVVFSYSSGGDLRYNYCANPSFEVDTTGWQSYPVLANITGEVYPDTVIPTTTLNRDTLRSFTGSASMRIETPRADAATYAAPVVALMSGQRMTVSPGDTITFSAYVASRLGSVAVPAGTSRPQPKSFIGIAYYNGATLLGINWRGFYTRDVNKWVRMNISTPVSAINGVNPTHVSVCISALMQGGTDAIWVDGVLMERSSTLEDYFDGHTNPGSTEWTGTANSSASTQQPTDSVYSIRKLLNITGKLRLYNGTSNIPTIELDGETGTLNVQVFNTSSTTIVDNIDVSGNINTQNLTVYGNANLGTTNFQSNHPYNPIINILPASLPSRRAAIYYGSWMLGQDHSGTGNDSFFLWNSTHNRMVLTIGAATGSFNIGSISYFGVSTTSAGFNCVGGTFTANADSTVQLRSASGNVYLDTSNTIIIRRNAPNQTSPNISGYDSVSSARYGIIVFRNTGLELISDVGSVIIASPNNVFFGPNTTSASFIDNTSRLVIRANQMETLYLRSHTSNTPYISFWSAAGNQRLGYFQFLTTGAIINQETGGHIDFYAGGGFHSRLAADKNVYIGKSASNLAANGIELFPQGRIAATRGDPAYGCNIQTNLMGFAIATGAFHAIFYHDSVGRGGIARTSGNNISFNTSSDKELKDNIEDIDPEVAAYVMRIVKPVWFTWKEDPDKNIVSGYIAQQVAEVWPQSIEHGIVTPGQGTEEDEAEYLLWRKQHQRLVNLNEKVIARNNLLDAESPNRWTELKVPEDRMNPRIPWMMDMSKLTPVAHAAWLWTDSKMELLEQQLTPHSKCSKKLCGHTPTNPCTVVSISKLADIIESQRILIELLIEDKK